MKKNTSIFLTCKDVTYLSSQREERPLAFSKRLQMWIHLMTCPPCRRFIRQAKQLRQAIRQYSASLFRKPPYTLPAHLKKQIQDELQKPQ